MTTSRTIRASKGIWYVLFSSVLVMLLALSACNTAAVPDVGEDPAEEAVVEEVPEQQPVVEVTEEVLQPEDVLEEPAEETVAAVDQVSIRASNLLDYDVYNEQGEQWGEVDDLAVGLDNEQVLYMIMSFGGFLDIGDESIAVPIEFVALTPNENAVTLNVDEEMLATAPNINLSNWTEVLSEEFDTTELDEFWDTTMVFDDQSVVRATYLLDNEVLDQDTAVWGEVEDMIINLENGNIEYVVLSSENFLAPDEYLAVPLAALTLDATADVFLLNVEQEVLGSAPAFAADVWPDFTNPDWASEWGAYWDPIATGLTEPAVVVEEPAAEVLPEEAEETVAMVDQVSARVARILDLDVVNANGEQWGEVDDLAIGQDTNQVRYLVMSFGGFLDLGDETTVVPIDAVALAPTENSVILNVDQSVIENAPTFNFSDWIGAVNPEWDSEAEAYWETVNLAGQVTMEEQEFVEEPLISANDLLGYNVNVLEEEGWGEVEDVIFNLSNGQIQYAVVSSAGFFDLNEEMVAVPYEALNLNPESAELSFNVDLISIEEAPTFTPETWPDISVPDWDVDWANYWNNVDINVTDLDVEEETVSPISQIAVRAERMLDLDVVNADGEQWGEVDDLAIGRDTNQVRYLIMSFGGFLDIGDETTVIPIDRVAYAPGENSVTLNVDQSVVENAPRFEQVNWTDADTLVWSQEADTYWESAEVTAETTVGEQEFVEESLISVNDLLGYDVYVPNTEDVGEFEEWGEVDDIVFNLSDGQLRYVVLSSAGFFDLTEEMVAVPLDLLTLDPETEELNLSVDQTILQEAPTFTDDSWPNLNEPEWDSTWARYWAENRVE